MAFKIVPIAEQHIEGFRAVLDAVAREKRYLAFLEAPPIESVREFVTGNIKANYPQYVALADRAVVGWCDVVPKQRPVFPHAGVLGMGIIESFRGQGIGAQLISATLQAAKLRGLTRVELDVRVDNARAIKLYEKFAFAVEGRMRHYMLIDGEYIDGLSMACLL